MIEILAIKPGPKPKNGDGPPDKREPSTPKSKPKPPGLKPHDHEPGD